MRHGSVVLWVCAAAASAVSQSWGAEISAQWSQDGREQFFACQFKQAARAFETSLAKDPASAELHFWLGKSYARLAEVSSPLSAGRNARKAQRHLEQAVTLNPRNDEYLQELLDFYLDSPQWFGGGFERARALLARLAAQDSTRRLHQLAESRSEYRGAGWWMRWAFLRTSGAVGSLVP
jgi:tetratricopeptide (TPR) repeat protein